MADNESDGLKGEIIRGIIDRNKPGPMTLDDLAAPVASKPAGRFARAISDLRGEGVLTTSPTKSGDLYNYQHSIAKSRGYV